MFLNIDNSKSVSFTKNQVKKMVSEWFRSLFRSLFRSRQQAQVELLPWVHDVRFQAHKDLVEYVKKLPKNSVIALEITYRTIIRISRAMDILAGKAPRSANLTKGEIKAVGDVFLSNAGWMFMELLQACRARNHKIVPIDLGFGGKRQPEFSEEYSVKHAKATRFADQHFADTISTLLSTFKQKLSTLKQKKLFVVVGAAHVLNLQRELKSRQLHSFINDSMLEEKLLVRKFMRLDDAMDREFLAGNTAEARKIEEKLSRLQTLLKKDELSPIRERIVSGIRQRSLEQEQRAKERLAARKQRRK